MNLKSKDLGSKSDLVTVTKNDKKSLKCPKSQSSTGIGGIVGSIVTFQISVFISIEILTQYHLENWKAIQDYLFKLYNICLCIVLRGKNEFIAVFCSF